jgi:WD40 repeat protein
MCVCIFSLHVGTFASGGCDATVSIWDGENKKKLRNWTHYPTSISALAFNQSGNVLAVAASYTWEEGEREYVLLWMGGLCASFVCVVVVCT